MWSIYMKHKLFILSLVYIINKFETKYSPYTDKLCDEMFLPQNFDVEFI